jgi:hypothetical protein
MQSGNDNPQNQEKPKHAQHGLRNRIAGLVAIVFGIAVLVILVIENRWDAHDNIKPLKALLGSIFFIAIGIWYFIKGAKAEPWVVKNSFASETATREPSPSHPSARIDLNSLVEEEMRTNPKLQKQFQERCQTLEIELREVAKKMEERAMKSP